MNYFGLFFSFMIPGMVIGLMAAYVVWDNRRRQVARRKAARRQMSRRLYVCNLEQDGKLAA